MSRKIVVNSKVRALLRELDETFERYGVIVSRLSESQKLDAPNHCLVADKRYFERVIFGMAWRINKESTKKNQEFIQ